MAEDPHKTWGTININPEPAVQTRMDYDPVTGKSLSDLQDSMTDDPIDGIMEMFFQCRREVRDALGSDYATGTHMARQSIATTMIDTGKSIFGAMTELYKALLIQSERDPRCTATMGLVISAGLDMIDEEMSKKEGP